MTQSAGFGVDVERESLNRARLFHNFPGGITSETAMNSRYFDAMLAGFSGGVCQFGMMLA